VVRTKRRKFHAYQGTGEVVRERIFIDITSTNIDASIVYHDHSEPEPKYLRGTVGIHTAIRTA
jgi:hypothetical protein